MGTQGREHKQPGVHTMPKSAVGYSSPRATRLWSIAMTISLPATSMTSCLIRPTRALGRNCRARSSHCVTRKPMKTINKNWKFIKKIKIKKKSQIHQRQQRARRQHRANALPRVHLSLPQDKRARERVWKSPPSTIPHPAQKPMRTTKQTYTPGRKEKTKP